MRTFRCKLTFGHGHLKTHTGKNTATKPRAPPQWNILAIIYKGLQSNAFHKGQLAITSGSHWFCISFCSAASSSEIICFILHVCLACTHCLSTFVYHLFSMCHQMSMYCFQASHPSYVSVFSGNDHWQASTYIVLSPASIQPGSLFEHFTMPLTIPSSTLHHNDSFCAPLCSHPLCK